MSYRGRGRGRGGYYPGTGSRGYWWPQSPAWTAPLPRSANKTLILNKPSSTPTPPTPSTSTIPTVAHTAPAVAQVQASSANIPLKASNNVTREVTIDGIVFLSDPLGRKLVRKQGVSVNETLSRPTSQFASGQSPPLADSHNPANARPDPSTSQGATPNKASVSGETYVRTKSGNLVALALVKKRALEAKRKRVESLVNITKGGQNHRRYRHSLNRSKVSCPDTFLRQLNGRRQTVRPPSKKAGLCRFFTSTGECRSGLTCRYTHDPSKVAICPHYLRGNCTRKASCLLSHEPDPRRLPHCTHFPNCRKGSDCPYPHVRVARNAKVCASFGSTGWCERGLTCPDRHVRECPEFSEKGTCSTLGCKLPHVVRSRKAEESGEDSDEEEGVAHDAEPTASKLGKRPLISDNLSRKRVRHDHVVANDDYVGFDADDSSLREEEPETGSVEEMDVDSDDLAGGDDESESDSDFDEGELVPQL